MASPDPSPAPFNQAAAGHAVATIAEHVEELDEALWGLTMPAQLGDATTGLIQGLDELRSAGVPESWPPTEDFAAALDEIMTGLTQWQGSITVPDHSRAAAYLDLRGRLADVLDRVASELGISHGLPPARQLDDLPAPPSPTPTPSPSATPGPAKAYRFTRFETARFEHFTVTVESQSERDPAAVMAEVCVAKSADTDGDGVTAISLAPWRMVTSSDRTLRPQVPAHLTPAYPASIGLAEGACVRGWIQFPLQGTESPVQVTYANALGDMASWQLPRTGTTARARVPRAAETKAAARATQSRTTAAAPVPVEDSGWDQGDREWAAQVVDWVLADIDRADRFLLEGRDASLPMDDLAAHMIRLQGIGAPGKVDAAEYHALCGALAERYQAAYTWLFPSRESHDLFEGAAAYTVARTHTQELLDLLAPTLGTRHVLPTWSFMGE